MTTIGRDHGMIADLPEHQRCVLHLRLVRGLSVRRTAEVLGSDPTSVLLTQHEALNALRRRLGHRGRGASGRPSHS